MVIGKLYCKLARKECSMAEATKNRGHGSGALKRREEADQIFQELEKPLSNEKRKELEIMLEILREQIMQDWLLASARPRA